MSASCKHLPSSHGSCLSLNTGLLCYKVLGQQKQLSSRKPANQEDGGLMS